MTWTFLLVCLWLKDGTPEPHVVTLLPGVQCTADLAFGLARRFIDASDHKDRFTTAFDFACDEAQAPKPQSKQPKGST